MGKVSASVGVSILPSREISVKSRCTSVGFDPEQTFVCHASGGLSGFKAGRQPKRFTTPSGGAVLGVRSSKGRVNDQQTGHNSLIGQFQNVAPSFPGDEGFTRKKDIPS